MQKYRMSNKASILSVLTLVISLVAIGLVSTGCGGGGGPTNYTITGVLVDPSNNSIVEPGYGVSVTNGNHTSASTITSASGAFSLPLNGAVVSAPSPALTLSFTYPTGAQDGSITIPITNGMINGTTINLGNVPGGPPTAPLVRAG